MRVFILGAGATGGLLAQLLRRRGHTVWRGDRDPARARRFVGRNIECRRANARSLRSVVRVARGCQLLVNTAPAVFNETVMRAALRLRAHYLDLASHLSRNPFKAEQLRFDDDFARRGRVALINAGLAPGLTNVLVGGLRGHAGQGGPGPDSGCLRTSRATRRCQAGRRRWPMTRRCRGREFTAGGGFVLRGDSARRSGSGFPGRLVNRGWCWRRRMRRPRCRVSSR